MQTDQELFWKGQFGDAYCERNVGKKWVASNLAFFSQILRRTKGVKNILELGSNIGLNLMALNQLMPDISLSAVEINDKAAEQARKNVPNIDLYQTSILDFEPGESQWDLVFTKGVLIHINPDRLDDVYDIAYACAKRYILIAEYYNPSPVAVEYRGHQGKLFKRDFAGEIMDKFSDLALLDYGFFYRRDPIFPQDDTTWFLLEKK